ncbi:MAG: DUF1566 domain-containing protein, partial [Myxococcaceae bacterium]
QFQIGLCHRKSTCTQSESVSQIHSIPSSKSAVYTPSRIQSLSASLDNSVAATQSWFNSESPSLSPISSISKSQSETSSACMSNTPPSTGLLASWEQSSGVYDDATNQMFRYSVSNGIVNDALTAIQWQQNASSIAMNCTDAAAYCRNQTTGGFNDWRVPNIVELQTLVDYTLTTPFINTAFFKGAGSLAGSLWSSTPDIGNAGNSWYGITVSVYDVVSTQRRVRCARSCYPTAPISRYMISSGVVVDAITGLTWQRISTGGMMNQSDAFSHCNSFSLTGINFVWRLPTIKELSTLIDYNISNGNLMMNVTAFLGEPLGVFSSSTLVANLSVQLWDVYSNTGRVTHNPVSNLFYVRCVACSVPSASGLLAAWNQTGGTYFDATNQTNRYSLSNGIITDVLTGIQWQQNPSPTVMNFTDAAGYCANQTTGGLNGWRLPNNAELTSLVDYTVNYVGVNPGINSVFNGTPTNYFYSSTPLVGSLTQEPWWMSFGQTACYSGQLCSIQYAPSCTPAIVNQGYVRCVRSCYPVPASRYTTTPDTAVDTITGLIWQRVCTGGTMNQTAAIAHCGALSLPSFSSGWRLPKVKELATLVDYSVPYNNLMMDAMVFAGEPANAFWSSSSVTGSPAYAWFVGFSYGYVSLNHVFASLHYVRCVR